MSSTIFKNNLSFLCIMIGGLPLGSGTLAEVDVDPKTLNSCREI
jgi:hypothetical protein